MLKPEDPHGRKNSRRRLSEYHGALTERTKPVYDLSFLPHAVVDMGDSEAIKAVRKIHFFQIEDWKKLAEAGPPGKPPYGNEGRNLTYLLYFQDSFYL